MPAEATAIPMPLKFYKPETTEEEFQDAVKTCRKMIRVGSKSFSLSAFVFNTEIRDAAFCLYGWCRYCDDVIDGSILGHQPSQDTPAPTDSATPEERLKDLKRLTKAAYAGEKMTHPVFVAFQHITHKYNIPIDYALDLLEGMAMDIRNESYNTINDLLVYCYRVAGTVGLMMSHIMGLSDDKALLHAASLGKAMQLTNIARDVMEDARLGRIYLPLDWLKELGIPPQHIQDPEYRPRLAILMKRLLAVAEVLYQSGDRGLRYLSFRAACAISSARSVYSEIGRHVLRSGEKAWDQRTIVSLPRKLFVMMKGITRVTLSIPSRLRHPWKPQPIQATWRDTL